MLMRRENRSKADDRASTSRDNSIDPALRANPFSEVTDPVCRLPLPTLFDRPEAVHLGDLLRIWVRPRVKIIRSHGFSRASSGAPDATRPVALCGAKLPISGRTDSRAAAPQREKKTLPGARASVSVFVCVTACVPRGGTISTSRFGNLDPIPFRMCGGGSLSPPRFGTAFACSLGSTDPRSTAVHVEPFSTSAFKVLV